MKFVLRAPTDSFGRYYLRGMGWWFVPCRVVKGKVLELPNCAIY